MKYNPLSLTRQQDLIENKNQDVEYVLLHAMKKMGAGRDMWLEKWETEGEFGRRPPCSVEDECWYVGNEDRVREWKGSHAFIFHEELLICDTCYGQGDKADDLVERALEDPYWLEDYVTPFVAYLKQCGIAPFSSV